MVRWYWTQRVRGAFSATRSTSTITILLLKFIPLNDYFRIEWASAQVLWWTGISTFHMELKFTDDEFKRN